MEEELLFYEWDGRSSFASLPHLADEGGGDIEWIISGSHGFESAAGNFKQNFRSTLLLSFRLLECV